MKTRELKELKLTKNIIIPFPNFQQNTIISPTQMNDNFEEIEYAYNNLIDNHNGALEKINKVLSDLTSSDNEAIVNEQERIEAEEIRVNNEEERIANEEERKTEETKRIAMYNVHLNDEIRREQKHIQMVGEFDTKVGEVDTLISTKTEEYNSFVETKTEEYNTFVETKEVEIQNAINSIPPKSELIGEKGDKGDKGEKGDKGDRGEQGLQGIQGIQGLQGVKGDKGDKGEQGIQGLKGDKGDKGDRGEQGVKGDTPSITHLETSINNKIQEVETRFNTLTSAQQQSSEVIDARDGETSLKARLDRDIEKAKQVYVNVEGSHISTDSSSGYAKDVEILGNTIQSASNLADIRSVGDKVEGQELYEIPVVSCGKNLFDGKLEAGSYDAVAGTPIIEGNTLRTSLIKVLPNTNYIYSSNGVYRRANLYYYDINKNFISYQLSDNMFTTPTNCYYIALSHNSMNSANLQLEEGTKSTPYEPYQEDKLTILSPVQLEKVGDVRDRIIEKDGVWGVEKNVETVMLDGSENWNIFNTSLTTVSTFYVANKTQKDNTPTVCSTFNSITTSATTKDEECISGYGGNKKNLWVNILKDKLSTQDVTCFKEWLSKNSVLVKFILETPQFIPLPHDQQIKLRTFANKTNISFGCEIEGTIKAQVPKSLGATVNTHTTQINNLNKELDRVKKLEESTVSTVTTESDFTTVEATSNGYFEDVKLEGKTLVNLLKQKGSWTPNTNTTICYCFYELLKPLEVGKTYTYFYFNLPNTITQAYLGDGGAKIPFVYWGAIKKAHSFIATEERATLTSVTPHFKTNGTDTLTTSEIENIKVVLLEGDHTQNPPSFFEGLKSVGDTTDEIVVSSVNGDGNLFDIDCILNEDIFDKSLNSVGYWSMPIKLKPNINYTFVRDNTLGYQTGASLKIDNMFGNYSTNNWFVANHYDGANKTNITLNSNQYGYIYLYVPNSTSSILTLYNILKDGNFRIVEGTTPKPYTPHQSDKKRLLYYNEETQTWEKPILREWDSIEKYSNGKYYYHQRSGEVVLDGSEDEDWSNHTASDNYISFMPGVRVWDKNQIVVCDKFKPVVWGAVGATDEFIWSFTQSCGICIAKSKLSTQDVEGFKQWLQANNVTVVYQLAQEKVYECTNIDLITYANETNYVVESGAIVPRTTLKVHNNISNVVNILQEKVSLLENKFIQGLKNVLAGDMYSLAELLYPEDFVSKEEPIDVPTLLI